MHTLEYRAHPEAHRFLADCCRSVAAEFEVPVSAIHRVETLAVGDLALIVVVAATHRAESFTACAELVERIKRQVPIWKRQRFTDGPSEWVGLDDCVTGSHTEGAPIRTGSGTSGAAGSA